MERRHLVGALGAAALAKVAQETCTRCAEACKKHAGQHQQCKGCMQACEECIKQCKAVAASA